MLPGRDIASLVERVVRFAQDVYARARARGRNQAHAMGVWPGPGCASSGVGGSTGAPYEPARHEAALPQPMAHPG